jgi:hypothetical protein
VKSWTGISRDGFEHMLIEAHAQGIEQIGFPFIARHGDPHDVPVPRVLPHSLRELKAPRIGMVRSHRPMSGWARSSCPSRARQWPSVASTTSRPNPTHWRRQTSRKSAASSMTRMVWRRGGAVVMTAGSDP